MDRQSRLRRFCAGLALTAAALGLPAQALAQETVFASCRVTTAWEADPGRDGNWGPTFTLKIDQSGIYLWRSENRSWRSLKCNPIRYTSGEIAVQQSCSNALAEGEAWQREEATWPAGNVIRSRFHLSRTTGIYTYESVEDHTRRTWYEEGVCEAAENPETRPTQRVL